MSSYSFIASDYELPEVENPKIKYITVKEAIELGIKPHELVPWEDMSPDDQVLIVKDQKDFDELTIKKHARNLFEDISWYTNKPYIYNVQFCYSENRAKQLISYLQENIRENYHPECWTIWLGEQQKVIPVKIKSGELSAEIIQKLFDWKFKAESQCFHECLAIYK